jgi:aminoglycoside phosphotransferase (APT) family kinase protein
VASGWDRLADAAPRAHPLLEALGADPSPLVDALSRTPHTVVQGDWKLGNLGSHADGRTILIDWDRCGRSPHTVDLAWYLAVNCDRMPEPKEDAIAWYRAALERRGVDTGGWFEEQLALALLGGMLQLGWAKAGGNPEEIAWWEARALEAAPLLGSDSRKE